MYKVIKSQNVSDIDDCEGASDDDWTFYADRPEWSDVQPVLQNDGVYPVVSIAYSEKFMDVFNYFRAILQRSEKSQRAFDLTTDAVKLNPANYTVWQYRREILKQLDMNLEEEMNYLRIIINAHPKNYQVWHHRRILVEWSQDPSDELDLTADIILQDSKNYHAWQHRQWVIQEFKLNENELEYVETLLDADIRNNSAWNQRFFIIKEFIGFTPEVVKREIDYSIGRIRFVKNNESAWNYLRGVLDISGTPLANFQDVRLFAESLYNENYRGPFLLTYLFDLHREIYLADLTNEESHKMALHICSLLANEFDVIRSKYWNYLYEELENVESMV